VADLVQLRRRGPVVETRSGLEGELARALGDGSRVLTRPIDLAAYAGDASVYRLVPRAVVRPRTEDDVRALFAACRAQGVPITFRAAGTSLSGQAVTDGVLVDLSRDWGAVEPLDDGRRVRVQPGVIAGHVNAALRPMAARIGPDPASIDACMMGGVLANNASGMCCGVSENAYHTLDAIRFVLPSGTVVDTSEPDAGARLRAAEPALYDGLAALRARILASAALTARIRAKYRIKNTTGYALNAFLDHDTPEQILAHVLIGSEGTLAFIASAVLRTFPDCPAKRTALLLFPDAVAAFDAVAPFVASGARAIEFLDDACLRAVDGTPGLGVRVADLPRAAAALLVEYQAESAPALAALRDPEATALARVSPLFAARFTEDPAVRAALWKIRKGLYPSAGATKQSGETVIIEDVAFPLDRLSAATGELKALLGAHGYDRALVFGHAKDGNCHFVITPSFNDATDVTRYERLMGDLVALVLRHDGSLKAEHGTGRNVAPFVEAEWGGEAYAIMRALKELVDPRGLLSPDVLLTRDPRAHVRHLKSLPRVEDEIDRCVECGFCEPVCPSRRLTLTPRQRIAVRREMARLDATGGDPAARASLERDYAYDGLATCAADGMCATACPVHIDTGKLVKRLRAERHGPRAIAVSLWAARHFAWLERSARASLRAGHLLAAVCGVAFVAGVTRALERLVGARLPKWSAAIPRPPKRVARAEAVASAVHVPSCMARVMGRPRDGDRSLTDAVLLLASRAGVPLRVPPDAVGQCCGLAFGSKGYVDAHALLLGRLVDRMWTWSDAGALPIVIDSPSCLNGMREAAPLLDAEARRRLEALRLVDLATYTRDALAPRLPLRVLPRRVVLHPACASRKIDDGAALLAIAAQCASRVDVPTRLGCCAMAGDRGLLVPELTASAVAPERAEILAATDAGGHYGDNLTCEIGMTQATGLPYRSFIYLVEEASRG
jgi:D-lactate dehydrogenase